MSEIQLWLVVTYGLLVILLTALMLGISHVVGERRASHTDQQQPYESGILPTHSAAVRIPIQFYLMAMFFVIFDMESVFIFAWAMVVREAGWLGFGEMAIFIGILLVALLYLWRIGALDWGPRFEIVRQRMQSSLQETRG